MNDSGEVSVSLRARSTTPPQAQVSISRSFTVGRTGSPSHQKRRTQSKPDTNPKCKRGDPLRFRAIIAGVPSRRYRRTDWQSVPRNLHPPQA